MSVAKYDWKLGQALYFQGVSAKDIATRLGCSRSAVEQRLSRHGLPALKRLAIKEATNVALKERGENVRAQFAGELEKTVSRVIAKPIPNAWSKLDERERVMASVQRRAFAAFGLNDEHSVIEVRFNRELPSLSDQPPAIDV